MDIMLKQLISRSGLALLVASLAACGGGDESAGSPDGITTSIEINAPVAIEKAIYGRETSITVNATASNNAELKLSLVTLRETDATKCELLGFEDLTYTFTSQNVGECQFDYEVTPISSSYVGNAKAKTRVAISMLNDDSMVSSRSGISATADTITSDTILPVLSAAYYADGLIPDDIDLTQELSDYDLSGYSLDSVTVVGSLTTPEQVDFDESLKTITLPALNEDDAGYTRIEYSLTNGSITKLGWIDVSVSNRDGVNRNPTLTNANYNHPDTIWVQTDSNDEIKPNTNEVIINISKATTSTGSITVTGGGNSSSIPTITMNIVSDLDIDDDFKVVEAIIYNGIANIDPATGRRIEVNIDRGGSQTLAYVVSDEKGGFVIGRINFKMPVDIYSYNQEWFDITIPTTSSNASIQNYLNVSTGRAPEITFAAPLATELAFFLDAPYRSVNVEQGDKGPEGYAITTYSYSNAQKYCNMRNARLPTINEMRALVEHQGNNLYTGYQSPYTKAHNWPTSLPYWVGKKSAMDRAYAFDLNLGTEISSADTAEGTSASDIQNQPGFYTTCVYFDEAGEIKNYSVVDMQQSREESTNEDAWIEFQLVDPEGVVAGYEYVEITPSKGAITNTSSSPINYTNPPNLLTARDGMIYFYYNLCKDDPNYNTCIVDYTQASTITVTKNNRTLYLYPFALTDIGESTYPVGLDILNLYATDSGNSVTINQSDNASDPNLNASIIRMPINGGSMDMGVNQAGLNVWHTSSSTYKGGYLYRYPFSGTNFSMMFGLSECFMDATSCSLNTNNSSVVIGLQQGFLPYSSDNIFTTRDQISGASDYFFDGSVNDAPAVRNNKNLMFNIRRSSGMNTFYVQTQQSLNSTMSVSIPADRTEYYWLDYDNDTNTLSLYNAHGQGNAIKPTTPLRVFTVDWSTAGIDPTQPYYVVIGYYRSGGTRNQMVISTLKYKSWY